jgi:hypothetical protein
MKRKIIQMCSLFGLLIGLTFAAQAQIGVQYRARIPFDFNVGNKTFAAGDYIIGVTDKTAGQGSLTIRAAKGGAAKVILAIPKEVNARRTAARLVFNRYENQYFLAEMLTPTLGAEFQKTKIEDRFAREQKPKRETVTLKR